MIHEIQRCGHVTALIPRMTDRDVRMKGFFLPKGTSIFLCVDSVFNDPKYFPEPEKFDPGRYITEEGETITLIIKNLKFQTLRNMELNLINLQASSSRTRTTFRSASAAGSAWVKTWRA